MLVMPDHSVKCSGVREAGSACLRSEAGIESELVQPFLSVRLGRR
jgi:hypothetical protein